MLASLRAIASGMKQCDKATCQRYVPVESSLTLFRTLVMRSTAVPGYIGSGMLLLDAPTLVVADVLDCRLLLRTRVDPSADTMKADEFTVADAARVKLKEAKEANRDSADTGALIVVSLGLSSFLFLCSHCFF
jgi:hypothetical protein